MTKRVLLVNPAKQDNFVVNRINMGLSLIGQILVSSGHIVKIMDYSFLQWLNMELKIPTIEEVIREFETDVIGVSVFTYVYDECLALIERISRCGNIPIILGGPHFTIFPEDFRDDTRISYIVRGEAERTILNLVETAKCEPYPVLVECPLPSPDEIPPVNLDIAFGSEFLSVYQIQLSRGCPYGCSFCNVRSISGRKVRERDLTVCLDQIVEAKERYPNIRTITITDDCPMAREERFKQFLRMYRERGMKRCNLAIDNMRADSIDEEMIRLYVAAGGQNVSLGVESGHPEVFNLIHKGETLEDIVRAAKLVRKYRLRLGLCFVIGLPEDNLKRHLYSLRLAKSLKSDYIHWNMCIPWPGTEVSAWYAKYGEIGDLRNFSTLIDKGINYQNPPATTPAFPVEDRIKAWLMANMETCRVPFLNPRNIPKVVSVTREYKLYHSLLVCFISYIFYRIMNIIDKRILKLLIR